MTSGAYGGDETRTAGTNGPEPLLLLARSPSLALFGLVTLHLKTLARKQFLIEPTNVRHGRALGQAVSGWQFHWFHPATLLTSS